MDLFTYLMAKNGNNSSVHGDLFSYLLGKGQSQTYTVSGTTIYIPNAKKLVNFMLTKESSQHTTSGKNLLNVPNQVLSSQGLTLRINNNIYTISGTNTGSSTNLVVRDLNLTLEAGTYTMSTNSSDTNYPYMELRRSDNTSIVNMVYNDNGVKTFTINTNETIDKINLYFSNKSPSSLALQIEKGSTATPWEQFTNGPSPNPDYPQEVKVVEGYRNLFDKENIEWYRNNSANFSATANTSTNRIRTNSFAIVGGKTYTFSGIPEEIVFNNIRTYDELNGTNTNNFTRTGNTFTLGENVKYIHLLFSGSDFTDETNTLMANANIQIVEGDQELPYVPYGNNYIAVNVSDGNTTNSYPIPLNGNEIAGIGNYLDELIVDKEGHVWLKKTLYKKIFDGTEDITYTSNSSYPFRYSLSNSDYLTPSNNTIPNVLCNYFKPFVWNASPKPDVGITANNNEKKITFRNINISSLADFKLLLSNAYNNNNPVVLYYPLATPELIDLQTTVDLKLFKGVNNITNSEDGYMTIEYR